MRYIKVLRGKFSAVDLREEPCNNGLPEKEKLTRENEKDNIKNCTVRRGNRANLQAGQRKTPCPPPCFFQMVVGCSVIATCAHIGEATCIILWAHVARSQGYFNILVLLLGVFKGKFSW